MVTGKGLGGGLYPIAAVLAQRARRRLAARGRRRAHVDLRRRRARLHRGAQGAGDLRPPRDPRQLEAISDLLRRPPRRASRPLPRLLRRHPPARPRSWASSSTIPRAPWPSCAASTRTASGRSSRRSTARVLQFKPGLLLTPDALRRGDASASRRAIAAHPRAHRASCRDADAGGAGAARALRRLAARRPAGRAPRQPVGERDLPRRRRRRRPPRALRLHREGYHSREAIASELAWATALRAAGVVATPVPLPGTDGRLIQTSAGMGRVSSCSSPGRGRRARHRRRARRPLRDARRGDGAHAWPRPRLAAARRPSTA